MKPATKEQKELAHAAGRAALSEPPERRTPEACPFSPVDHPEQRAAWLAGFEEALDEVPTVDDLRRKLKEASA